LGGHADSSVCDGEGVEIFVCGEGDGGWVVVCVEEGGVRKAEESSFVEGVCGIGEEFPQEDVAVLIEGVCDNFQDSVDFCGKGLGRVL
jgi:hypothetical protein